MKKQITLLLFTLLFALTSGHVMAQKNVLYIISHGVKIYNDNQVSVFGNPFEANADNMDFGTACISSLFGNDPVLRMLKADSNFTITYITARNGSTAPAAEVTSISGAALPGGNTMVAAIPLTTPGSDIDTTGFDLVILTENIAGNFNFVKIGGQFEPSALTVPVIYGKSQFFNNSITASTTSKAIQTQNMEMEVVDAASPLLSGLSVTAGDMIPLFKTTSDDYGAGSGQKAIDVVNVEMNGASTLVAKVPEADAANSVVLNFIKGATGVAIGSDTGKTFSQDAVIMPFSWGAIVKQDGGNITGELLTIWRNAAYLLTGLTMPTSAVTPDRVSTIATTTVFYDYRNGTYFNTTTDGTLLENDGSHMSADAIPIELNTAGRYESDLLSPVPVPSKNSSIRYTVGGANFANTIQGVNLKEGDNIHVKNYGTCTMTLHFDAASDLNLSVSAPNISQPNSNKKIWAEINGENLNDGTSPNMSGSTYNYTMVHGVDNTFVVKAFSTLNNNSDFAFTAAQDGVTSGTNAYVQYIELSYDILQPSTLSAPKEIAYVQKSGFASGPSASSSTNDPIIRMFQADPNFNITVIETDAAGTGLDLSIYNLVIAQETFGSGDGVWSGAFDVQTNNLPIIYNKTWAWQASKNHIVSAAAAIELSAQTSVSVEVGNQANDIFSGIDFAGGTDLMLYNETAGNGGEDGTNAIDVLNNIEISVAGTNLATVSDVTTSPDSSIIINVIPQGTQIGTDTNDLLQAPTVAFAFNYGAIIRGDGANITSEALTLWRNAAYMLTGQSVPTTLYINPDYVTLGIDKVGEVSAVTSNISAIGNRIYVSNVKSSTEVKIYSITGALVKSFKTNEDMDFSMSTGLWIATVKTYEGAKAVKLLTK